VAVKQSQLLEVIRARQSARTFSDAPVSADAVTRILEAARHAPSGANRQGWHFVVVDDPDLKRRVRETCEEAERQHHAAAAESLRSWYSAHDITPDKPFLEQAPVLVVCFYDPSAPYAIPSVWIAITHMLLQATGEGLHSLPYTPSGAQFASLLGVPKAFRVAAILPIGVGECLERRPRLSLDEIASRNRFGSPVERAQTR